MFSVCQGLWGVVAMATNSGHSDRDLSDHT